LDFGVVSKEDVFLIASELDFGYLPISNIDPESVFQQSVIPGRACSNLAENRIRSIILLQHENVVDSIPK